jgi:hypothetical protein
MYNRLVQSKPLTSYSEADHAIVEVLCWIKNECTESRKGEEITPRLLTQVTSPILQMTTFLARDSSRSMLAPAPFLITRVVKEGEEGRYRAAEEVKVVASTVKVVKVETAAAVVPSSSANSSPMGTASPKATCVLPPLSRLSSHSGMNRRSAYSDCIACQFPYCLTSLHLTTSTAIKAVDDNHTL